MMIIASQNSTICGAIFDEIGEWRRRVAFDYL